MAETTTSSGDEHLTIIIKQLDGTSFNVELPSTATVGQLKQAIQRERDVVPERQRLIYRAQELKVDEKLLLEYGIVNQSTLHIVIRPLGAVPINNYNPNQGGDVVVNMPQNVEGYANPYEYNPHQEGAAPALRHGYPDVSVLYIVKLCRFVRIFAIMDFMFLLLFGLSVSAIFFLMAALALAGYYGAKLLKRSYLVAYIVCLVLEIVVRGIFIYLVRDSTVSVILFILMIFIDLFVLRCVFHLYKAIPLLDADQQSQVLAYNRVGLF